MTNNELFEQTLNDLEDVKEALIFAGKENTKTFEKVENAITNIGSYYYGFYLGFQELKDCFEVIKVKQGEKVEFISAIDKLVFLRNCHPDRIKQFEEWLEK